jgi:mannose-6-phosphate isomerase-like protein (cupin superfamily)
VTEYPERRKTLNVLKEVALTKGSYDEFPVAPAGVDPAPHLSRNTVPQPFWLVTEKDEILVTMSGAGQVGFKDAARTTMTLGPGDVVYMPARTPSRIVPDGELVQVRLKSVPPFTEAVAWYCDRCDVLMHREEFTADVPQRAYWEAVARYNSDVALRTCGSCGHVHDPADMGDISWDTVAELLETAAP